MILTTSEVIEIHEELVAATGGASGIRNMGLLESAVMGCSQSFGGVELYPTIPQKAARMAYAISKNHPFVDGNKRVSVTAMLVILRMNGVALSFMQEELIELGLGIANDSLDYEAILTWIYAHLEK